MSASRRDLEDRLDVIAAATEAALLAQLDDTPAPGEPARAPRLMAAMRYAAQGGKRIRPLLVVESAALFGVDEKTSLAAAAAFECVHCYSLVHDDLPAMDDDDMRRGQPTVHAAFDEATAILAGDSLLTLAFESLASMEAPDDVRVALVSLLARASGVSGMAGGQMFDLEAEGRFSADRRPLTLTVAEIETMQRMKTGALLSACCEAGAILGRASADARRALGTYAHALGLAFQIADDLLDAQGEAAVIGKATAKDAARGKATLVSLLGLAGAHRRLAALTADAKSALEPFGPRGATLTAIAEFILLRDR